MPVTGQLLPGVRQLPTGYNVANSLRFNGDNFLSRTNPSATSTNDKKGTFSFWIKRASFPNESQVLIHQADSSPKRFALQIANNDEFIFSIRNDAESVDIDGTTTLDRVYRDVSAWTNFVFNYDTSGGTNGCKLFVNGTEQALTYSNTLPQNFVMVQNTSSFANHTIGRDSLNSSNFWTGYMTEVMFVDGQQLAPTEFGEYDSDSPTIWKPKDITGIDVGNLGYYLDFENSSALGTDAKSVGNFSTTNCAAIDQSTDTCTNNFATLNPLNPIVHDFEEGNLRIDATASNWDSAFSTIGASSGKWYFELKFLSKSSEPLVRSAIGVVDARGQTQFATNEVGYTVSGAEGDSVGYNGNGSNNIKKNDSAQYSGTNWNVNDIICMAVDLDNGAVYFRVNDSAWLNSGDPTSGSTKTGAVTITTGETYVFGGTAYDASTEWQFNFGAPSFSISSGNADANGHGNFEYAVPSGYFALCTKNLAENG
jgi:hypothetical protein